jgi:hypothetical protein
VRPGRLARDVAWLVASVVVGVATHLLLDLVTHESRLEVAELLDRPVGEGVAVHDLLQVVLSLLGLAALVWWAARWARTHAGGTRPRWSATALVVGAVSAGAAGVGAWRRMDGVVSTGSVPDLGHDAVAALLGAVSAVTLVLVLYAAAWWARRWITRGRRRPDGPTTSPTAPPVSRTPG